MDAKVTVKIPGGPDRNQCGSRSLGRRVQGQRFATVIIGRLLIDATIIICDYSAGGLLYRFVEYGCAQSPIGYRQTEVSGTVLDLSGRWTARCWISMRLGWRIGAQWTLPVPLDDLIDDETQRADVKRRMDDLRDACRLTGLPAPGVRPAFE